MSHPIELGNILLILVGIGLIIGGPVIVYRTIQGEKRRKAAEPKGLTRSSAENAKFYFMTYGSHLLNILIGVVVFIAGINFVLNNLRGNPLA